MQRGAAEEDARMVSYYEILDAAGRWYSNTPDRREAYATARKIGGRVVEVQS